MINSAAELGKATRAQTDKVINENKKGAEPSKWENPRILKADTTVTRQRNMDEEVRIRYKKGDTLDVSPGKAVEIFKRPSQKGN